MVNSEQTAHAQSTAFNKSLYFPCLTNPSPPTTALNPDARPLGTYKTKMAVSTGKWSILTILRENRELRTVYFCLVLFFLDLLCVASRFLTWNAKRRAVRFLRFGVVRGCDAMVTLFCYLHGSCAPTRKQMWRPTSISELVKRVAVVLINKKKKQEKIHVAGKDLNGIIELHCNDYTTTPSSLLLVRSSLLLCI